MEAISLDKKTCEEFIINKHYSRKMSIFWKGFGLIEDNMSSIFITIPKELFPA